MHLLQISELHASFRCHEQLQSNCIQETWNLGVLELAPPDLGGEGALRRPPATRATLRAQYHGFLAVTGVRISALVLSTWNVLFHTLCFLKEDSADRTLCPYSLHQVPVSFTTPIPTCFSFVCFLGVYRYCFPLIWLPKNMIFKRAQATVLICLCSRWYGRCHRVNVY